MGNSSIKLQRIVDSVSAIGDLQPLFAATGGFADEPACTIANDVMQEIISERFPWKWNRKKYPPFFIITRQQDYASLHTYDLGWIENAYRILMNVNVVPPPVWPIEVVRDLPMSRVGAGWPQKLCWFANEQLEQRPWPGPGYEYTFPLGLAQTPYNHPTNICDKSGLNILVLTTFGKTGAVWPEAPAWAGPGTAPDNWPIGQVIQDGTCKWTVADPQAQGMRLFPPPAATNTNTWLIRVFYQKKAPYINSLQQKLNPIPDDYIKWFRDGFIAYAHRYSSVDKVKARYPLMKQEWIAAMIAAAKQGDREEEGRGFYPDRGLLSPEYYTDPGPGNPYWRQWGGA